MTFTWFGRQMETANVGNTAISYEYNADGLRTSKTVGNAVHTYEYTGSTLYYENRGGIQLHYRYDVNGNLASITRIDTDGTKFTLYAVCNSRGDVEELRKLSGTLYARYIYDTWGNTIHIYDANGAEITSTANLAVQNPFRYRGYYYDAETGFYYLQSRYYDPVTCRFVNADTLIDTSHLTGFNTFAYCLNNPVIYVDYSGMAVETVWDIISFLLSLVDVCINPADIWAWLGLGMDTISMLVPFLPALGVATKIDDVYDIFRWLGKTDDVVDAAKTIENTTDVGKNISNIIETTRDSTNISNTLSFPKTSSCSDIFYTDKVLYQMSNVNDLNHSFPIFVDSYVDIHTGIMRPGGDGVMRNFITFPGTINNSYGFFEYIIEPNGMCNHRYFNIIGEFR